MAFFITYIYSLRSVSGDLALSGERGGELWGVGSADCGLGSGPWGVGPVLILGP
jgi:hypothetical protein